LPRVGSIAPLYTPVSVQNRIKQTPPCTPLGIRPAPAPPPHSNHPQSSPKRIEGWYRKYRLRTSVFSIHKVEQIDNLEVIRGRLDLACGLWGGWDIWGMGPMWNLFILWLQFTISPPPLSSSLYPPEVLPLCTCFVRYRTVRPRELHGLKFSFLFVLTDCLLLFLVIYIHKISH
jgi:hypothetical protein